MNEVTIDIYDIMASTLDNAPNQPGTLGTNSITAQIGNAITGAVFADNAEFWNPTGLLSIPSNVTANPEDAAQCISIHRSNQNMIIATRDVRVQQIMGNMKAGETCLYATGADGLGQSRVIIKQTGDIYLYTTSDNTSSGDGVYFKVGPSGLKFVSSYGMMIFDNTGFHVITQYGARLDLGSGGPTSPAGKATLTASVVSCKAPMVTLGPDSLSGGLGYMPAAYGLIPGPKFVPILGEGVGAVVVNASASSCVLIAP